MTRCAVEAGHASNIHAPMGMARNTGLRCRLRGMQRREMAGETLEFGPNNMDIVTGGLSDLLPLSRAAEVAFFADRTIELSVRRDLFDISRRPAPDDPGTVLDMLFVASFARHFFMRSFLPGVPGGFHDVAGSAKSRIVFDIIVGSIARKRGAHDDNNQYGQYYDSKSRQNRPLRFSIVLFL